MLTHNNIAILWIRLHALVKLHSPTALLKNFPSLDRSEGFGEVLPADHGVGVGLLVQAVKDWDVFLAGGKEEGVDVGDCIGFGEAVCDVGVGFAGGVEEVVVGVNEEDGCFGSHSGRALVGNCLSLDYVRGEGR